MNPLVLVLLFPLALLLLGRTLAIYPRRAMVWLAVVPVLIFSALLAARQLFAVLSVLDGFMLPIVLVLDTIVLLVMVADLLTLPRRNAFVVQRDLSRIASLKLPHPVKLTISNRSGRAREVWVRDDIPDECEADPEQVHVRLVATSRSIFHYELTALRRGKFHLEAIFLRTISLLRLWQRDFRYEAVSELHVYPDMRQLREYSLLARTDRLNLVGLRRTRRIGQDNEFERLRDYTLDDNYKFIDWRTTARRGKLTVKDFQANQSQRVIFLVDCGRMMTNTAEGISLLDHSFNAALMLSYIALNKGDSVGLLCFSDEVQAYVPPKGGMQQMNRLLHASFDRFPRLVESRYDEAFVYLNARCRKRALVVLLTNVIDEVNSMQIQRYLTSLVGRHLPLGVLLRDHAIFDAAVPSPTHDLAKVYEVAAAQSIVNWRAGVLRDLETQGVLSLDVFPEQMTAPLVNRYLEIKARHLL